VSADLCGEKLSPAFVGSVLEELSVERAYLSISRLLCTLPAGKSALCSLPARSNFSDRFGGSIGQQAHAESALRVLPAAWTIGGATHFPNHERRLASPTCDGASLWASARAAVKAVALHRLTGWEGFFPRQLD